MHVKMEFQIPNSKNRYLESSYIYLYILILCIVDEVFLFPCWESRGQQASRILH